jgi:hypothetical protein
MTLSKSMYLLKAQFTPTLPIDEGTNYRGLQYVNNYKHISYNHKKGEYFETGTHGTSEGAIANIRRHWRMIGSNI